MKKEIEKVINEFNPRIQRKRKVWCRIGKKKLFPVLKKLNEAGFKHLSAVSAIDWIEEKEFEIIYHLWSYTDKILLNVKTRINRNNPSIKSVYPIWKESAGIHEREIHELFGINFEGNPDLSPLFLEDWERKPPFRKDFNWREFVKKKYYSKNNEREKAYLEC